MSAEMANVPALGPVFICNGFDPLERVLDRLSTLILMVPSVFPTSIVSKRNEPFSVPPKNGDRTSPGPHEHRLDGPRRGARAQRGAASVHAGTLVRSRNHLTSGRGARRQSIRYIRPPVVTKVRSESDAEPRVSGRLVGYMIQCQYASMSVPVCSDSHAMSYARVM